VITGHAVKTCQNARWVADQVEPSRRREDLSSAAKTRLDDTALDRLFMEAECFRMELGRQLRDTKRRSAGWWASAPAPNPKPATPPYTDWSGPAKHWRSRR
jgi:hypothetical protein